MQIRIPGYLFLLCFLLVGILLGGTFPEPLAVVSTFVNAGINVVIKLVPVLIFLALSPAIASLADSGRANSLVGSVILWYFLTSLMAGFLGLSLSAVLFNIPLSTHTDPSSRIINNLFTSESGLAGSRPLFTIFLAVCFGFLGSKWKRLHDFLEGIQSRFFQLAKNLRLAIVLFILLLGISVGVRFGAQLGLTNYLLMTCYTLLLCLTWASFYFFVLLRLAPTKCTKGVIKNYYLPTAVFAAGTCSSLITLPLNLVNIKKQGVSSKIADFVLPIGSVINLDASALA